MDGSTPELHRQDLSASQLQLEVSASAATLETDWRRLEKCAAASVYQSFDWIDCWVARATGPQKIRPAIVSVRYADGTLVAILPLGVERLGPFRIARFLGGEHANIRMGLLDPEFAAWLTPARTTALLDRVGKAIGHVDLFDLDAQPVRFHGEINPLAAVPMASQARCDVGMMRLAPDFSTVLAAHRGAKKSKKRRWQANTLAPVGGSRLIRAGAQAEAEAILEAYFAQKAEWFRGNGIADSFAEPGVADFFRALVARRWTGTGSTVLDLDAVEIDGKVRAILGSGTHAGRLSGYFMSVANDEWRRVSPGELMLFEVISASCERGLTSLDLGRGDERYKASWLDEIEPHVRAIIPVTLMGTLAAALFRASDRIERAARDNPKLWQALKRLRRWRRRAENGPPADAD
ncbi:GNAT family N-acetyltransferase [Kaistia adipata]|uniref:GNAT family N-acetyltransferase n=1 Tax=Kaistia adipata TaxID=166954 RepID=UPI000413B3D9|nr:GNAT family N-acetyltransferase [Kaistia adipata]